VTVPYFKPLLSLVKYSSVARELLQQNFFHWACLHRWCLILFHARLCQHEHASRTPLMHIVAKATVAKRTAFWHTGGPFGAYSGNLCLNLFRPETTSYTSCSTIDLIPCFPQNPLLSPFSSQHVCLETRSSRMLRLWRRILLHQDVLLCMLHLG
jgi:hypothetical protein